MNYPQSLINVIEQFKTLPGIGPKSAERIALHLLKTDTESVNKFANSMVEFKNKIKYCSECSNLSENDLCEICSDQRRDKNIICIVETPKDLQAIEKTKKFHGFYHVLLGKISPLDGIGPDQLKIKELIKRIEIQKPQEVIIATSADVEGEATALYLVKLLKPSGIKVTRIAYGIPVGTALELADEITLTRSLEGRQLFA
jgi:recombination protein RecR